MSSVKAGPPPEAVAEWGCAYVLRDLTKRTRPLIKRAYKADTHEERERLIRESAKRLRVLARALESYRKPRPGGQSRGT